MAETALTVENLGKKYRLGTSAPYHRLSEMLQAAPRAVLTAPWKRWRKRRELTAADTAPPAGHHPSAGEFWAVRDVSFEVRQGEVVGIIGRNGAGKSTLLKLLSRITEPTTGRFGVRGRVGSLLEVGTGFHPELTGRENIELSGTLLGMNRREIRRHFDEIVAFAEIDDFLDTPVKRYSSGMYVRLGFAIAAHLNPEILIVDEVLAVGDAQFQKKCLGKMNDVAASGRTVLFVSHDMGSIQRISSRCLHVQGGSIREDGPSSKVVQNYLAPGDDTGSDNSLQSQIANLEPDAVLALHDVRLTQDGRPTSTISSSLPFSISLRFSVRTRATDLRLWFDVFDSTGVLIWRAFHDDLQDEPREFLPGTYQTSAEVPSDLLGSRPYVIEVRAGFVRGRHCVRPPVTIPLKVVYTSRVGQVFPHTEFVGRIISPVRWAPLERLQASDFSRDAN